jgi:hypothetical protein
LRCAAICSAGGWRRHGAAPWRVDEAAEPRISCSALVAGLSGYRASWAEQNLGPRSVAKKIANDPVARFVVI